MIKKAIECKINPSNPSYECIDYESKDTFFIHDKTMRNEMIRFIEEKPIRYTTIDNTMSSIDSKMQSLSFDKKYEKI